MEIDMKAIKSRASVRTYTDEPLTEGEREALRRAFAEAVPGPFGATPRFLASRDEIEDDAAHATTVKGGLRIGTYGMIVGPRVFISGVVPERPFACVDFGCHCLEGIVLRATEMGLGTCWIGGAFGRGAIARGPRRGEGRNSSPRRRPWGAPRTGRPCASA